MLLYIFSMPFQTECRDSRELKWADKGLNGGYTINIIIGECACFESNASFIGLIWDKALMAEDKSPGMAKNRQEGFCSVGFSDRARTELIRCKRARQNGCRFKTEKRPCLKVRPSSAARSFGFDVRRALAPTYASDRSRWRNAMANGWKNHAPRSFLPWHFANFKGRPSNPRSRHPPPTFQMDRRSLCTCLWSVHWYLNLHYNFLSTTLPPTILPFFLRPYVYDMHW